MLQYFFDFDRLEFVSYDFEDVSTEAAVDVGADVLTSSDTPSAIALDAGSAEPDPADANATPDLTSSDLTISTGADQGASEETIMSQYFFDFDRFEFVAFDFADVSTDLTNSTGADQGIDLVDTSGVASDSTSAVGAVAESEECVRCMLDGSHDQVDYEAAITVEGYNLFGLDFFG